MKFSEPDEGEERLDVEPCYADSEKRHRIESSNQSSREFNSRRPQHVAKPHPLMPNKSA